MFYAPCKSPQIDSLVQDCRYSDVLAMELP